MRLWQVLYNDQSPMENHHVAAAFDLMLESQNNFMCNLPRKVRSRPRFGIL